MTPTGSGFVPAHVCLGAPVSTASRFTLILHGILGSGRHWRGFGRGLAAGEGEAVALVDLRGHGRSHGAPGPHTLMACAEDLVRLQGALGRGADRVIGHSFGGKVALVLALRLPGAISEVWSLDSPPGGRREGLDPGPAQIDAVLRAVSQIPLPVMNRQDAVRSLEAVGLPAHVAAWMGTNLAHRPDGEGLTWSFHDATARELLRDYFLQDLWPDVRGTGPDRRVHLVRAAQSDRWDSGELRRLQGVRDDSLAQVHLLPSAGHWLHVDNPTGLAALLHGSRDCLT